MADMELIIKIPKDYYEVLQKWADDQLGSSECFIKHGTPLPTGHEGYRGKEMKKPTEHQIHEFAEQIYNIGFEDGYIDGKGQKWTEDQLKAESEMYAKGLNDAWECARKIVTLKRTAEEWDLFDEYMNVEHCIDIFEKYSASEAIEKIKEYEAKQKQSETSYETHCKIGHCKDCKYFEYDSMADDGTPFIIAHNICNKWGNGCKTKEDGYCFMFESREVGDVE